MKPWSLFVFVFALACERTFITTHSVESRCYRSENYTVLQVRLSKFKPGHFTGSGSERVKEEELERTSKCPRGKKEMHPTCLGITIIQCSKWFWSCLPLWTAACLHSVSYTTLFFWHTHAGNPTIQTQDSWLSHLLLLWTPHLEFTPTRP